MQGRRFPGNWDGLYLEPEELSLEVEDPLLQETKNIPKQKTTNIWIFLSRFTRFLSTQKSYYDISRHGMFVNTECVMKVRASQNSG